jgi:hypothetical protein
MREKVARLERSAAAWEAGAAGERATGGVLAGLDPEVWSVLHDVRWPGRMRANIDHVAIGPAGVFVIDSKGWSGHVAVKNGVLRQNGYSRDKEVAGAAEAAIAVLKLVPDVPVQPVICLVRDEPLDGWVRDVMLCSTGNLRTMLATRPPVLSPDDVRRVAARLGSVLQQARPVSAPSPGSTSKRSPRKPKARTGPSGWRVVAFFVVVALMFGALQTGLWTKASEVIAEHVVDLGTEDDPVEKPVKKPARDGRGDNGTKNKAG